MEKTREAAIKFVENGGKCLKQYGFTWKGARAREITNAEARKHIASTSWSFSKGYYELDWVRVNDEICLKFTEYSEADMW